AAEIAAVHPLQVPEVGVVARGAGVEEHDHRRPPVEHGQPRRTPLRPRRQRGAGRHLASVHARRARAAEVEGAAHHNAGDGGGTGRLATSGTGSGPTVLLRADMDALPSQEEGTKPYVSRVPGVMHACGHDGHVAMAVTAARALVARGVAGTVRMLFQPAEEGE